MSAPDLAARARRLADGLRDLDGYIASDIANVRWLSGTAAEPHVLYGNTPMWAVLGPGGDLRLVAAAADMAWLAEDIDIDLVVPYGRFAFAGEAPARLAALTTPAPLHDALTAALDAVDAGERVGVDDGMALSVYADVAERLVPRVLTIDPQLPLQARGVKDVHELELLAQANRIAEDAILVALEAAAPGLTERELLQRVRGHMIDRGARPMLGSVGIGERGALVDSVPTDRALRAGDVIRFDVGCTVAGYHSDLARTAILGRPDDWIGETYGALLAGEQAAIDRARPGVTPTELYHVAVATTREAGLHDYDRSHCGHGIGLEIYEPPLVAPGGDEPLREGQTLCLETPYYALGRAGVQVEDAVVITSDGCRRLGAASQDLIVI
jgi:Xaa-Pro aminopeptidase